MSTVEVYPSDGPLRVDAGDTIFAVGRIFLDHSGIRGASLFTLINPIIRLDTYSSTREIGQVQVVHPRLVDGDEAFIRIGYFEFDSLQFMHTYDNIYKYRGWLTVAKAYDPDTAQKMIETVVQQDEHYEYLPPDISIRNYDLPMPVSIEICYSTEKTLNEWLEVIESR